MQLHGYGLVVGIAIVVGWMMAERQAIKRGITRSQFESAAWWAIGLGIVGARLYHVVDYWEYYLADPVKIFMLWQGGLGIWGGVVGGIIGVIVGTGGINQKTLKLMDVMALVMPLAQAIGRIGNWINGELYGKGQIPLFMVEALLNLSLFGLLNLYQVKGNRRGQIFGMYLVGYGIIRIILEPLRTEVFQIGALPVAATIGAFAILTGVIIIRKAIEGQKHE